MRSARPDTDAVLAEVVRRLVAEIGQQRAALDGSLEPLCRSAEGLTTFAWIFRYPGEPEPPPVEGAIAARALSRDVDHAVLSRLPGEVRP